MPRGKESDSDFVFEDEDERESDWELPSDVQSSPPHGEDDSVGWVAPTLNSRRTMEEAEWKQLELLIVKTLHPKMQMSVDPLFTLSADGLVWPVMPHVAARLCNQDMSVWLTEHDLNLRFSKDVLTKTKRSGDSMRIVQLEGAYNPETWKLKLKARHKSFSV